MKNYGNGLYKKSKGLNGAVSDSTYFITFGKYADGEANVDTVDLSTLVDKNKFTYDYDNDIYVNENGAVADAYFLAGDNEEVKKMAFEILISNKAQYPDYELKLVPGEFPMDATGEFYSYNKEGKSVLIKETEPKNSTYVLYITNYKDYLTKNVKKNIK